MPVHPPSLPLSPSGWRKSSWSSLPSDSSFSALSGLVGDPVEDFLPLSPEIIAIEESLPMALTALPVFWKIDTGVGLRRCHWFQLGSGAQGKEPSPGEAAVLETRASCVPRFCRGVSPTLLCSALSACQKMFGEWNGAWNRCVR